MENHKQKKNILDPDYLTLVIRNRDLETLRQGTEQCLKKKPITKTRIRKEAFDRCMKLIYGKPLHTENQDEDISNQNAVQLPPVQLPNNRVLTPPTLRKSFFLNQCETRSLGQKVLKEQQHGQTPERRASMEFGPNSKLVGQQWVDIVEENAVGEETWSPKLCQEYPTENDKDENQLGANTPVELQSSSLKNDTNLMAPVEKPPKPPSTPPTSSSNLPESLSTPLICENNEPQALLPGQPAPPSSQISQLLKQFIDNIWFMELLLDDCALQSLSPEDFMLLLVKHMKDCEGETKLMILNALLELHQQEGIEITEHIQSGLLDVLQSTTSLRTQAELQFTSKLLELLVSLGPAKLQLAVELLTFLGCGELTLQNMVVTLLKEMGVEEAEIWLSSEVERWGTSLQSSADFWEKLRKTAAEWLEHWICQYKVQNQEQLLQPSSTKDVSSPVDVLNFVCSQQRKKQECLLMSQTHICKNTMLLSSQGCRLQPIQHLGEKQTLGRKCHAPGTTLPPLLTGFVPYISLPLAQVSLCPFSLSLSFPSHENRPCLKTTPKRYFALEHSYVEYYR
ncbi:hypothetical protein GN956_G15259 [Arapaima gigas]